jgi:hypothetical protein
MEIRGPKQGRIRLSKPIFGTGAIGVSACLFLLSLGTTVHPQGGQQANQGGSGMGVATGGAHPAVKDALSRPITAGGFVDGATVVFCDITKMAGLDKFVNRSGTPEKETILETIGSGVALLDYDNDGGSTAARNALPQQSRRNIYGCHRQSGSGERAMGIWRGRGRL